MYDHSTPVTIAHPLKLTLLVSRTSPPNSDSSDAVGDLGPQLSHGRWAHLSPQPKQHPNWLNH